MSRPKIDNTRKRIVKDGKLIARFAVPVTIEKTKVTYVTYDLETGFRITPDNTIIEDTTLYKYSVNKIKIVRGNYLKVENQIRLLMCTTEHYASFD